MPRPKKQLDHIKTLKKKKIMDTALELFASYGYHGTTMEKIATRAGVSKGLIYTYFKNKEDLLLELLESGLERISEKLDPNHDGVLEKHELLRFVRVMFEELQNNPDLWKMYFGLSFQKDVMEIAQERLQNKVEPIYKMLYQYFEQQGYARPMVEAVFFGSLMDGLGFNFILSPENFPLEEIIEKVLKMYDK